MRRVGLPRRRDRFTRHQRRGVRLLQRRFDHELVGVDFAALVDERTGNPDQILGLGCSMKEFCEIDIAIAAWGQPS